MSFFSNSILTEKLLGHLKALHRFKRVFGFQAGINTELFLLKSLPCKNQCVPKLES